MSAKKLIRSEQNVFIFYYSGHGTKVDEAGNFCLTFKTENAQGSPEVDWKSASRIIFNKSQCQQLLLPDCCHAGAMHVAGPNSMKEILIANCSALVHQIII
jgi:Caspase domain